MAFGLFICLFGSFLFGLEPVIIKHLQIRGYDNTMIIFWLFFISLIYYALMFYRKRSILPSGKAVSSMLFVGMIGMGATTLFLISSYLFIPTGTATLIHFTYPIIVVIGMRILFKHKLTGFTIAACCFSLCGMICITNFAFGGKIPGYLLALISAFCYAFYDITNEKAFFKGLPTYTKMTFLCLGVVLLFGLLSMVQQVHILPFSVTDSILILSIGLMNCFGHACLMIGLQIIGAAKTAFAATMEPVTSVVLSIIVYQDPISYVSLIGILFIILSVILISFNQK